MFCYRLNYTVRPEAIEQFIAVTHKIIARISTLDGHIQTEFYQRVEQPCTFMICSHWSHDTDFRLFVSSAAFKEMRQLFSNVLAEAPSHQHLTHSSATELSY